MAKSPTSTYKTDHSAKRLTSLWLSTKLRIFGHWISTGRRLGLRFRNSLFRWESESELVSQLDENIENTDGVLCPLFTSVRFTGVWCTMHSTLHHAPSAQKRLAWRYIEKRFTLQVHPESGFQTHSDLALEDGWWPETHAPTICVDRQRVWVAKKANKSSKFRLSSVSTTKTNRTFELFWVRTSKRLRKLLLW